MQVEVAVTVLNDEGGLVLGVKRTTVVLHEATLAETVAKANRRLAGVAQEALVEMEDQATELIDKLEREGGR